CQLGCGSKVLGLPPVAPSLLANSFHTVSPPQVVPLVNSSVPLTATTYCESAGHDGTTPPVPHSSALESPVEMEKVWFCATACWKMLSSSAAPLTSAPVSQPPIETLITLTRLSVTTLLKSAVRSASDRVGVSYRYRALTPPLMPTMSWVSRSHSPSPLVSVPPPFTSTTFSGMLARPFCERNFEKSLLTLVMLPWVITPTGTVEPVAVLPAP